MNLWNKKEKKNTETNDNQEVVKDVITEAILNHLQMRTTGALLLTGDWGSGKTHHLEKKVFPIILNETEYIPLLISLYGEAQKENIPKKVLFAYLDFKGKKSKVGTARIAKNLKNLSDSIPIIKKVIDIEKLISGSAENIFKILPHQNLLLCFDDLERMSEKIDINDFLGLINDLVEKRNSKILLVANEEEITRGIGYKEKTIEKTIHFIPDIAVILNDIIASFPDSAFKKYLKNEVDFIISTINSNTASETFREELSRSYSNIRTIKFALEHFRQIFEIISSKKKIDEDLTKKQLKNLWMFCISISIEFRKKDGLSFTDRKQLDAWKTSFNNIDLKKLNLANAKTSSKKPEELDFNEKFKRIYYNRFNEDYIYYPQLYDFITSGKKISTSDFIRYLDESFQVTKEGKVNPAHALLDEFMHGWWNFPNEEFETKFKNLLQFVEDGLLNDITSYLNASVYFFNTSEIVNISHAEIVKKVKTGLKKLFKRIHISSMVKTQFEMVVNEFKNPSHKVLIDFIRLEIQNKEDKQEEEKIIRLSKLFSENLESFVKEFLPGNNTIIGFDKSVLHKIDLTKINEVIPNWTPKGIMDFYNFLNLRYLENDTPEVLLDEYPFIETLDSNLSNHTKKVNSLSGYLIKTYLKDSVEGCKSEMAKRRNNLTT